MPRSQPCRTVCSHNSHLRLLQAPTNHLSLHAPVAQCSQYKALSDGCTHAHLATLAELVAAPLGWSPCIFPPLPSLRTIKRTHSPPFYQKNVTPFHPFLHITFSSSLSLPSYKCLPPPSPPSLPSKELLPTHHHPPHRNGAFAASTYNLDTVSCHNLLLWVDEPWNHCKRTVAARNSTETQAPPQQRWTNVNASPLPPKVCLVSIPNPILHVTPIAHRRG